MNKLPSVNETNIQDFYINTGLYEAYSFTVDDINIVAKLIYPKESLDCFCPECGATSILQPQPARSSPFVTASETDVVQYALANFQPREVRYTCTRSSRHQMLFSLILNKGILIKVGQYPSYADIYIQGTDRVKNLLPNDLFIEFKKSIGLYAHGVGAGSMVYLRRIIEKFMIEPAHQQAQQAPGWDEKKYRDSRVKDRMKQLEGYLPSLLIKNAGVYSIISKGIHELSEKDCLEYYPVLKNFLEFLLTDMKNKKEEEEVKLQFEASLSSIAKKIAPQ
jgi:hypothetical protein